MKEVKVSIIGVTGYGGVELIRIIQQHPVFSIHSIHSTKEEIPLWNEYPHLHHLVEKRIELIDIDQIADEAEIVFLATPSGVSRDLSLDFASKNIKLIDLSGDLRLKIPEDYEKWYKHSALPSTILNEAVYGLSEWNEEEIRKGRWIANPGCYSTAALLALAPVTLHGLIDPKSIIIDGKSGTSGAGKALVKSSMFTEVNENIKIYKLNEHQHIPEIEQQLKVWNKQIQPITFSTHLLPITRGIMTTIYANLIGDWRTEQIIDLYEETYCKCPFVRIRPFQQYPNVKEVYGSNYCDIGLNIDERTGRLTIVSVIDNLMKGAAGQAIQNANIVAGLDQTTGLNFVPIYP